MFQRFNSKISYWLFVPLFCLFIALEIMAIIDKTWPMLIIVLAVKGLIISLLVRTYYLIEDHKLTIICGFFFKQEINIAKILKVEKTNSPLSSPALSIRHRLEISYGKYDSVIISPERQSEFVETLKLINKNISTNL